MKPSFNDSLLNRVFPFFFGGVFIFIVGTFITIPIAGYFSAVSLQKSLNSVCGTNYSVLDVSLNGDRLTELCRIKNQQITVK
jgi:hypothetical protein